jgi:hypothetical protein
MKIVSGQIPPQQLIDIVKPTLTTDFEGTACRQLIKIFDIVSMAKS